MGTRKWAFLASAALLPAVIACSSSNRETRSQSEVAAAPTGDEQTKTTDDTRLTDSDRPPPEEAQSPYGQTPTEQYGQNDPHRSPSTPGAMTTPNTPAEPMDAPMDIPKLDAGDETAGTTTSDLRTTSEDVRRRAGDMKLDVTKAKTFATIDTIDSRTDGTALIGVAAFRPAGSNAGVEVRVADGKPGRYSVQLVDSCIAYTGDTSGDTTASTDASTERSTFQGTTTHGAEHYQGSATGGGTGKIAGTAEATMAKPIEVGTLKIGEDGTGRLKMTLAKKKLGGLTAATFTDHAILISELPAKGAKSSATNTPIACGSIIAVEEAPTPAT